MKMTSSQASKLLRQLDDELNTLIIRENNTMSFLASLGENPDSVRPDYDYAQMQAKQEEIETKIRRIKHALNVFNSTTIIPEFEITIDEMLVLMPQLTRKSAKLSRMKDALPKERAESSYGSNIIDYRYANYDIARAQSDYFAVSKKLADAQVALDYINNTVEFEIEI